ncbi:MAG TPA: GAF domain-containing protein [Terriglobales bacterium]|nr:GAF domain-containing protein [Terriglobales bacterium]
MSASGEWHLHSASPPLVGAEPSARIPRESADVAYLHGIVSRMTREVPFAEVLKEVVEFATSVVKCDSCFIYILEGDELVLRASRNSHPESVGQVKLKLGQGITGWVAQHRQPVVVSQNAGGDPRFQLFNKLPEDRFEAFLSVPLLRRGRVIGVINLQSRAPHRYSTHEITLLSTIGLLVGAEVEMARLEKENSELTHRLEIRKLVERAKGILQQNLEIGEEAAYTMLQRQSQQRRLSMRQIAEAVVLSHAVTRGS